MPLPAVQPSNSAFSYVPESAVEAAEESLPLEEEEGWVFDSCSTSLSLMT
jgi:hypothetical protein